MNGIQITNVSKAYKNGPRAVDEKMSKTPPSGQFNLQVRNPSVCRDMSRLPPLRTRDDLPNRLPTFLGPKR